jgi:hypothetical protein
MIQGQGQGLPAPPAPPAPPQLPTPFPGGHVIVQPLPSPPPWVTLPPAVTLLITLGFFAACAVVLYPLVRAISRRLEGRSPADPELRSEVEQLRHRIEDAEVLQSRVMELEERVDFTERLLAAQRREAERLPGA